MPQPYHQQLLSSFIDQATNKSQLHENIYNELISIFHDQNCHITNEYKLDCGYSIDIFLQYNKEDLSSRNGGTSNADFNHDNFDTSICIEIDGPDHFLLDSTELKGPTEMKYRHLDMLDHSVIQVNDIADIFAIYSINQVQLKLNVNI